MSSNASLPHQGAAVLWLTGLSGAGKSTIAELVAAELRQRHCPVCALDGDVLRRARSFLDLRQRTQHLTIYRPFAQSC